MTTPAEGISLPALLRAARETYIRSIREHLAAEGCDDMPRNGPFILGGMTNRGAPAAEMTSGLGVTRQAASQLIDTLVVRGYLTREVDPADRRRITISLTLRGQAAGQAVRAGTQAVDAELATRISGDQLAGLRAGLIALVQIKQDRHAAPGDAP